MNRYIVTLVFVVVFSSCIKDNENEVKNMSDKRFEFAQTNEYQTMLEKSKEFKKTIYSMINNQNVGEIIKICVNELQNIKETPYHSILKKDLLSRENEITEWIKEFYNKAKEKITVKAMYFEMNGFTINPDSWFVSGFAYNSYSANEEDYDWLSDWQFDTGSTRDFIIKGFEKEQEAYSKYYNNNWENMKYEYAQVINEYLVILRLQELFAKSYLEARKTNIEFRNIPIFVTAHDYDFIMKIL